MERSFVKLHGCGNDFIFFDDLDRTLELSAETVRWLCDRHFGIGADGVILVRSAEDEGSDAYMYYINADGSLAQMCGNGVRCFAKYLVDQNIVNPSRGNLVAGTMAGPKTIVYQIDAHGKLMDATVDMGEPVFDPLIIPVDAQATSHNDQGVPFVGSLRLESPWGVFSFACLSMGNPHAVSFIDDFDVLDAAFFPERERTLKNLDVSKVGAFFERHPVFPEQANIEFAEITPQGIGMRVYERGCGETLACGTGACATGVAASLLGLAPRENDILLRGGVLHILWDKNNHVLMTGPAAESFRGVVDLCQ